MRKYIPEIKKILKSHRFRILNCDHLILQEGGECLRVDASKKTIPGRALRFYLFKDDFDALGISGMKQMISEDIKDAMLELKDVK